jgi:hypothetical protein
VSSKGSAVKPSECGNTAIESHRSITLGKKMEVIRRMERVQTRPDVCGSMKLLPLTVNGLKKNADKIN